MPVFYGQIQIVKKTIFVSRKGSGNEAFPEWNPPCGSARGKGRVSRLSVVFSERYSAAQQRPFGAVHEANCLEQVPLYRQFLKKGFV